MSNEQVNHPDHYGGKDNPYEAIKVIEAWELGFCLGNTVKYIARAGKKVRKKLLEDLKKARWYLDRTIAQLESEEAEYEKSVQFARHRQEDLAQEEEEYFGHAKEHKKD